MFRDTYRFWKVHNKFPKLKRSSSDVRSPESGSSIISKTSHSLNNSPPASRKSPVSPVAGSGKIPNTEIDSDLFKPSRNFSKTLFELNNQIKAANSI